MPIEALSSGNLKQSSTVQ